MVEMRVCLKDFSRLSEVSVVRPNLSISQGEIRGKEKDSLDYWVVIKEWRNSHAGNLSKQPWA